jgi:hypothetical protein
MRFFLKDVIGKGDIRKSFNLCEVFARGYLTVFYGYKNMVSNHFILRCAIRIDSDQMGGILWRKLCTIYRFLD